MYTFDVERMSILHQNSGGIGKSIVPSKNLGQTQNRRSYTGCISLIFSTVLFQMFPQITCPKGCIITLVTFIWLFSTDNDTDNVCFQMFPQIVYPRGCIVTYVAFVCRIFVCLFFNTIDINWRLVIFTLITIIRVTFAMLHHDMSLQGTLISVCILAKLTFKTFFILHNPSSNDTNNWLTFVFNFFSLKSRKWK